MLGDTVIGWKSSTQKCVTTATCGAEYVALCDASKGALFARAVLVLVFLQPELNGMRVDIFGHKEGAKAIADNPSSASRSKHIDVKLHFIRGLIHSGEVRIFARRNRGAICRRSDEGSLEKENHGTPRGVDELLLTSCFERVFFFHLSW